MTKITGFECNKKVTKNKILEKSKSPFINNYTKRIEFPLTNKNPIFFKDYFQEFLIGEGSFFNLVIDHLIDMDNETQINNLFKNDYPEIIIDYSKDLYGEMKNLSLNETLSKIRKEEEKYVTPYSNNIIIIYIDSVSRKNALRQLKKTMKFVEQFMSFNGGYNPKEPSIKYHSFQFFKYHSFKGHTANNFPKIFYGGDINSNSKMVRITKYLKKNGYVTCLSNSECN